MINKELENKEIYLKTPENYEYIMTLIDNNKKLGKEIERLHSIIKEVREYIIICKNSDLVFSNIMYKELLEILDKADKDV